MNKDQKSTVIDEIHEKLAGANSFYRTDFTGMNVKSVR